MSDVNDTVILIISLLSFALICVSLVLLVFILKKNASDDDEERLSSLMADEFERNRRENAASIAEINRRIDETSRRSYEAQAGLIRTVGESLDTIRVANIEQNERLTRHLQLSLDRMQQSNEQKLDRMRETVDEKLTATITGRLDMSFRSVSERLESLNRSLGEMKELSAGVTQNVTALNRVLTNVKARGTWAEVQLENILDETIPGMYVKNFSADSGQTRVEFAVKLPAADGGDAVYLPIDSKFPMEDYARLCSARENADAQTEAAARKALLVRVAAEAKLVSKYIVPPLTTPYAVMYLATEGLFAEVISAQEAIAEQIKSKFNVLIAGPTTVTALLSSLSMGFKAFAINEKANEVRNLLTQTKAQYEKFGLILEKARRRIDDAGKALDEAQDRNRIINDKLKKAELLEGEEDLS